MRLKQAYCKLAPLIEFEPDQCGWMDLERLMCDMEPVIRQTVGAEYLQKQAYGDARNRHCYSVGPERYAPRYYPSPGYSNEQYELVAQEQGSSILFMGGERLMLREGEMILLLPGTWQRWAALADDSLRCSLLIQPSVLRTMENIQERCGTLFEFLRSVTIGQRRLMYRLYRVHAQSELWTVLEWLYNLYQAPYDPYQQLRESGLLQLFFSYLESGREGYTETMIRGSALDKTDQIITYIEDHLATVTRRELAEHFHYSERQVSRMICGRVGTSFSHYLQLVRLRRIASLLVVTDMSVGEIAAACGYRNDTYFYNLFRQRFGMSPTEYRNRM